MYKGFNRATATVSAGVVALGVHWIASKSGDKLEPVVRSGSVFLLGTYTTIPRRPNSVCVRTNVHVDVCVFVRTCTCIIPQYLNETET